MTSNFATPITMPNRADRPPLVAVLAAGFASRFGGGKLDADLAGKPLGQHALEIVDAAGLERGVIVVGPHAPDFASRAPGWSLVVNPSPEEGQGSSAALACRSAQSQSRGIVLMLADMPLVHPQYLRRVADSRGNAATRHEDGRLGVPVKIQLEDLGRFTDLAGDRGAGPVLAQLAALKAIEAPPGSLLDVDDAASLEAVRKAMASRSASSA